MTKLVVPQSEIVSLAGWLHTAQPPAAPQLMALALPDLGNIQKDFCSVWPEAKKVIQTILPFIGWVPYAQTALSALLTAGDAIAAVVCVAPAANG
jgi:hypothetical protein